VNITNQLLIFACMPSASAV